MANGDVVVGGYTHVIGGISVNHIARWDGSNWHGFGTGAINPGTFAGVDSVVVMPNGDLIAYGYFANYRAHL